MHPRQKGRLGFTAQGTGSIEVLDSPLGGALFRVRLPRAAEPALATA